jgi:hypothetical protein
LSPSMVEKRQSRTQGVELFVGCAHLDQQSPPPVLLHRLDDTGVDAGLVHSALRLGQFPPAVAVVLLGALALNSVWCDTYDGVEGVVCRVWRVVCMVYGEYSVWRKVYDVRCMAYSV